MMNAIYMGRPWRIKEDDGGGLLLENPENGDDLMRVEFGEKNLVIDPTDDEWFAAMRGDLPINYSGDMS